MLVDWNATAVRLSARASVAEALRGAGRHDARRGGARLRGRAADLRRPRTRAPTAWPITCAGAASAPGRLVGVCLERSLDLVVGAAGDPQGRRRLRAARPLVSARTAGLLIRETGMPPAADRRSGSANRLPAGDGVSILRLDSEARAIEGQPGEDRSPLASGDSVACVMYTSGSTGQPEGRRRPASRHCPPASTESSTSGSVRSDVFLQLAPISFDASTFEVWGALLQRRRAASSSRIASRPPADLRSAIDRHRVTTLWLTAALFNAIVDKDAAAPSPASGSC